MGTPSASAHRLTQMSAVAQMMPMGAPMMGAPMGMPMGAPMGAPTGAPQYVGVGTGNSAPAMMPPMMQTIQAPIQPMPTIMQGGSALPQGIPAPAPAPMQMGAPMMGAPMMGAPMMGAPMMGAPIMMGAPQMEVTEASLGPAQPYPTTVTMQDEMLLQRLAGMKAGDGDLPGYPYIGAPYIGVYKGDAEGGEEECVPQDDDEVRGTQV